MNNNEITHRVTFTYTFRNIDVEHKITEDCLSLERAKEYIREKKSKGVSKDCVLHLKSCKVEKITTTSEVVYEEA